MIKILSERSALSRSSDKQLKRTLRSNFFVKIRYILTAVTFGSLWILTNCQTQTLADERLDKAKLVETYLKHAFARSDFLIKPSGSITINLACSNQVKMQCKEFTRRMQKFVPVLIKQQASWNSHSQVSLEVRIFSDKANRVTEAFDLAVEPNLIQAAYDDGNCAAMQFLRRHEVRKVLIITTIEMGERLSHACILNELTRASGLSFREKFKELAPNISTMSNIEFVKAMEYTTELLKMHLDSRTHHGMTASDVIKAFGPTK